MPSVLRFALAIREVSLSLFHVMLRTNRGHTQINPLGKNVSWYSEAPERGKKELRTDKMSQDPVHNARYF